MAVLMRPPANLADKHGGPGEIPGPSPIPPQTVTHEMFEQFLEMGLPGSKITYHEGFLPMDRKRPILNSNQPPATPAQELTEKIARYAYWAGTRGLVELTQEKLGPLHYCYYATKRHGR